MPAHSFSHLVGSWALPLAIVLFIAYAFSLLARSYWLFDLFSHFTIQYAIGALVLALMLALANHHALAIVFFVICFANVVETRMLMNDPFRFGMPDKQGNLTIVQYNKLYRNHKFSVIRNLLQSRGDIDIVMIQESGIDTIEDLKQYKDIFPHQFPDNVDERFNDVSVLSKYPFKVTKVKVLDDSFEKFASRIEIKKPGFKKPVYIYSQHTITPMMRLHQKWRNKELAALAEAVKNDKEDFIIASGDWNITPYSPYFADFVKKSGLRYQNFGLLPETTWMSLSYFSFLKVPIDHILYKDGIELAYIKKGPASGSDHHPLIASFIIPGDT